MAMHVKRISCLYKSWRFPERGRRYCHGFSSDHLGLMELPLEDAKNGRSGPWLMFADVDAGRYTRNEGGRIHRCHSFSSGDLFSFATPQLQGKKCWGTPYGWLFTLNASTRDIGWGQDLSITLYNPLTHQQLPLPSQPTYKLRECLEDNYLSTWYQDWYIYWGDGWGNLFVNKFYLPNNPYPSPDSSSADFSPPIIMSIYGDGRHLAFASPGDETWKSLEFETDRPEYKWRFTDVIFYEGHFYSINTNGELSICDISTTEPKEKPIASFDFNNVISRKYDPWNTRLYLVEISGDLYLIHRASTFNAYKVDLEKAKLVEVEDFNGHALFVGGNTTFAVSTLDYPQIKPNCIYFTDDSNELYSTTSGMGVYDYGTRTFTEPFYKERSSLKNIWPPFFFMPSLSNKI